MTKQERIKKDNIYNECRRYSRSISKCIAYADAQRETCAMLSFNGCNSEENAFLEWCYHKAIDRLYDKLDAQLEKRNK